MTTTDTTTTLNRDRLNNAIRELEEIMADESVTPGPYSELVEAVAHARNAGAFVLDHPKDTR